MKKIIKDRDDIVFYIKMYPLRSHPDAYKKSKTIVCEKSLKLLEKAFAGKALPEPSCETSEVDDNIRLAASLGITATPTIILPDGAMVAGYKDADTLITFIEQAGEAAGIVKPEEAEDGLEGLEGVGEEAGEAPSEAEGQSPEQPTE